ncbi:MAG: (2Fe-2S) ferredoxin domain-containing protein [Moorea sp. SIO2B7]|nr:(2Fe-2S) ferredoxin domain-containing protein [Moorena sp. SIO2B7]
MGKLAAQISEFHIIGQLLGFVIKDGYKIKYLRITISEREYWIKPSKEIRSSLDPAIVPGCWVEVSGTRKLCMKTGKLKLKADSVGLAAITQDSQPQVFAPKPEKIKKKASILVCQKSSCRKRGGTAVCQMLEESLRDRGLREKVKIKTTGCLKQCKKGPNLVMMPDKARYSNVRPQQIPALIDKHIAGK